LSTLDLIASLCGKSLLWRLEGEAAFAAEPRYGMLETLREYGLERLDGSGDAETTRARHAEWCLGLAERAEPLTVGPQQKAWLDRLERDHDNLRAALAWTFERGDADCGLRLAGALWWYWWMRGYRVEGQDTLERLLALPAKVPRPVRAKALLAAGALGVGQSTPSRSQARLEESLALYREIEDAGGVGLVSLSLGYLAFYQGDWDGAAIHLEESLAQSRTLANLWVMGGALVGLAYAAMNNGDLARASALVAEALAVTREVDDPQGTASVLMGQATNALMRGDVGTATGLAREALVLTRQTGERGQVPPRLELLAAGVGAMGDAARAARWFAAAMSMRERVGVPLPALAPPDYEQRVATLRSALGETAFAAAWAAGRAMSFDEALAEAAAEAPSVTTAAASRHPNPTQRSGLTRRELMVLRLLVEGRSDKEIAAALYVSPRTATTHVASILGKLGVASRTAAAAVAVRRGLA
jgi:non-specific serine/threonine protein kinase